MSADATSTISPGRSPPVVKRRLCIDDTVVHEVTFEDHDTMFVPLTFSLASGGRWLTKAIGIKSLLDLPHDNVITAISTALRNSRGKKTTTLTKVDAKGKPQPDTMTVVVRGMELKIHNDLKVIHMESTVGNLEWLMRELLKDLGDNAITDTGVQVCADAGDIAGCDDVQVPPGSDDGDDDVDHDTLSGLTATERGSHIFWVAPKHAFIVKRPGSKEKKTFTVPRKSRSGTVIELTREQRDRAFHYLVHGEIKETRTDIAADYQPLPKTMRR